MRKIKSQVKNQEKENQEKGNAIFPSSYETTRLKIHIILGSLSKCINI